MTYSKYRMTVSRNTSSLRQAARKVGITFEKPYPRLPETEQEQTDTM